VAAVETKWFTKGGKNLVEAEIGWVTGPINVALMGAGFAFDQDLPEVWGDLSAQEATGIAYVAGGTVVANRSVVLDLPSNETRLLGDPVQWPTSTITARGAVIYATSGAKPVLGYVDFVSDRTSENGLFRIEWPTTGVLRARVF